MHGRVALLAASLFVVPALVAGCGSSSDSGQAGGLVTAAGSVASGPSVTVVTSSPPVSPRPTVGPLEGKDAAEVVVWLASRGVPVVTTKVYDEVSDPNHLLGRPGGYISKAAFQDKRVPADQYGPEVDDANRGGSVEVYAGEAGAVSRAREVQGKLKAFGLGTEYDYIVGGVLVRVTGTVTPTQASSYEQVLGVSPQPAA